MRTRAGITIGAVLAARCGFGARTAAGTAGRQPRILAYETTLPRRDRPLKRSEHDAERCSSRPASADFAEAEIVADGLGPRFNLDSCAGCHAQPAIGGSSPKVNPQVALAKAFGANNTVPSFIKARWTRPRGAVSSYKSDGTRDGGVHALYVISGRVDGRHSDARDCNDHAGGLRDRGREEQRDLPHPDAHVRPRPRRADPRLVRSTPTRVPIQPPRAASAFSGGRTGCCRPAIPTATATTAPSRGSAGRPRTSRCCSSPARPTTSRWASPTSCSRTSATRPRPASTRRRRTTSPTPMPRRRSRP